mmetsp:Transcript_12877/g.23326  ORF Transcript_12877/g.23326 Transcript_12877/m.23326 type:complete len:117 (-) Transcript_12877:270-620(-)
MIEVKHREDPEQEVDGVPPIPIAIELEEAPVEVEEPTEVPVEAIVGAPMIASAEEMVGTLVGFIVGAPVYDDLPDGTPSSVGSLVNAPVEVGEIKIMSLSCEAPLDPTLYQTALAS